MHRVAGLKVLSLLMLLALSGWGESSAEARLLRGRRQKCCCPAPCKRCCETPCNSCCETRDPPSMCVMELLGTSTGRWYYYAHHHENGTECPFYGEVIYPSPVPRSPVPMSCLDNECLFDYSASTVSTTAAPEPGLDNPISATDDLMGIMSASRSTKLDEAAGNVTLPDGRKIHVRVGVFKVKAPVVVDGVAKEVTEYFGFGFESADTGKDEIYARKVKQHKIGSTPQKNLYEFKIGTLKCVVLTVK